MGVLQTILEARNGLGGGVAAQQLAILVFLQVLKLGDVIDRDDVAFHAGDLRNLDDPALAITPALYLDDQVQRRDDLATNGA